MTNYVSARQIVTSDGILENAWVGFADGVITEIGTGPAPDGSAAAEGILVPGFVDIHCHGGGGATVVGGEAEAVATAARAHLEHGTTTLIASLVSGHPEPLKADVAKLADLCESGVIAGIHLEGPWISPTYKGAHDPTALRNPAADEVAALFEAGRGHVRMVTIAPELEGSIEAIAQIAGLGGIAAIGHTNATYEEVKAGIDAGATVATHLFNAMRPLTHRDPGPIAALTEDDRVSVEIVCDGVHVHSAAVATGRRAAEARVVLVTDAMAAACYSDGDYMLGDLAVKVTDGVARLVEGGAIAGSTLTMNSAFKFAVEQAGFSITEAVAAASGTPARLLGRSDIGEIAVGKRADLVLLTGGLDLVSVWAAGEIVGI